MNKCCSTCCNRISRKLANLTGHSNPSEGNGSCSSIEKTRSPRPTLVVTDDSMGATVTTASAGGTGSNDGRQSPSSGDEDALVIAVAPVEKKSPAFNNAEQLLPPRPVNVMEPRPLHMTRIIHHPGADNSETDSADEVAASGGANQQQLETSLPPSHPNLLHHGGIIHSNGSIPIVISQRK